MASEQLLDEREYVQQFIFVQVFQDFVNSKNGLVNCAHFWDSPFIRGNELLFAEYKF